MSAPIMTPPKTALRSPMLLVRARAEGLGQARRAVLLAHAHHDALAVLHRADGLGELRVEVAPVGEHHRGVEDGMPVRSVEALQVVREPCDGVTLSGAGAVLDEVASARASALLANVRHPASPSTRSTSSSKLRSVVLGRESNSADTVRFFSPIVSKRSSLQSRQSHLQLSQEPVEGKPEDLDKFPASSRSHQVRQRAVL